MSIVITDLCKSFGSTPVLQRFTWTVERPMVLMGRSGCGKTTLLRILTGVMDYDEGEVMIAPGKRMGLISQIPVYPVGYTVEDVLDTAFEPLRKMEEELARLTREMASGTDPALMTRYDKLTAAYETAGGYETDTRINKVCNGLSIPQAMREQLFDSLSGGEKTRVNLARLILEDTDILLLDEPLGALDLKLRKDMQVELKKIQKQTGITFVFVTHDMAEALDLADVIIFMDHGNIVQMAPPDKNANRQFFSTGECGEAFCTIASYCCGVFFFIRPPFLFNRVYCAYRGKRYSTFLRF